MMKELGQNDKQSDNKLLIKDKGIYNTRFSTQMSQNRQNANDILDGYLMTQDNGNKSGINLKNGIAVNGLEDDNELPEIGGGKLNKTNISMISAKSMS